MLTRALAKAFAPKVAVNSVAPGVIAFGKPDERVQRLVARTPAQRPGTGKIADAVVFFLSTSKFVTGQVLAVDRGLSINKRGAGLRPAQADQICPYRAANITNND
jgi:NAD(P)-dependent dehydrogenase (short-subunit alcohol dehydrogenase family)